MLSKLGGYSSNKKKIGRGFLQATTYNVFHVVMVTNFAACRDLDKHFSILQNIATATTSSTVSCEIGNRKWQFFLRNRNWKFSLTERENEKEEGTAKVIIYIYTQLLFINFKFSFSPARRGKSQVVDKEAKWKCHA